MKKIWTMVLAAVLVQGMVWAQFPKTIKDHSGRAVVFKKAPLRVVSMLPSISETVCALSVCERLLGVDDYSDYPQSLASVPKMGGLYNPNIEAIAALKPDVVLMSEYGQLRNSLDALGITTFVVRTESYADIASSIQIVGRVMGKEAAAAKLVRSVRSQMLKLELKAASAKQTPSVYYEIDPTPYSVGPNSFIGTLMTKAKGKNIIPATLGDWPQVSPELVIEQNPQVMIVTHSGIDQLKNRPGWSGISAVSKNRICNFMGQSDNLLSRPGPRIAQGFALMIKCLHPELVL